MKGSHANTEPNIGILEQKESSPLNLAILNNTSEHIDRAEADKGVYTFREILQLSLQDKTTVSNNGIPEDIQVTGNTSQPTEYCCECVIL